MAETINALFCTAVSRYGARPALSHKEHGQYVHLAYGELAEQVRQFASGLVAAGVNAGDRLALISENRPEWVIADLSMLALGAVSVPLFATLPAAQVAFIVADSGSRVLLVSDSHQRDKALEVRRSIPDLIVIAMEGEPNTLNGVMTFADVMERGGAALLSQEEFRAQQRAVGRDDLASIVYTSGTTGNPKGVMLSHGNLAANVEACQEALCFAPEDVLLSFLPLNHCLERTAGYYLPLSCGCQVAYAESLRRLRENIREVRPTYMIVVPRLLESFQEAIEDRVAKARPLRQRLFEWALATGRERTSRIQAGRQASLWSGLCRSLADQAILGKVRDAAGLGRMKAFVAGGAPLAADTGWFFHALGVPVLEGYGLSETSPVVTFNRPRRFRLGTVGQPLVGVEVRIGAAGEILCRGPNVMQGYHNRPEETAATLDPEGWLHTGDVGDLDADGFLRITDRIKDLLVLTNGKKVAPQPIESLLKTSPYISQAVLVGDQRPTVAALIVPAFDRVREWGAQQGLKLPEAHAQMARDDQVIGLVRSEIDRLSADLADFERIHGFALLDREFTVEGRELTPTFKVRRRVVAEKCADLISELYPSR